ncbi:MAG TPA: bifunctional helix-turn-helix transcriptional regulator/GNAT family N-acetyltransferase [Opitutaceae bacterium]|nr:bifunctional helix-turn-helix transcriptional regulator/GNAT family N-acetyltransferase [Opitutaceae bacterium]
MPSPALSVPESPVDAVRHFNRFYTRKIGVLNDGLLDSPFSLTEVRVLYELAHRDDATATDILRELDLDPGYLSRMLARFEKLKLVERQRSKEDGRRSHLRLTAVGRKKFASLNNRSNRQARELIGHLDGSQQRQLTDLMTSVRHVLSRPEERSSEVTLRSPAAGDLGWVVQRHGALYTEEYGWDVRFEGLVATIVGEYVENFDGKRDKCWIAEIEGQPVGCVFLVRKTDTVAKLRLLLVEPSARGRGVGRKLVEACIGFAREAGYRKILLWTNSVLTAARHIYEHAGFKLVKSEKHHSFGHDLVGETWELDLKTAK